MVFGEEGAVVPLLLHGGQPQHRQMAHRPDGRPAEGPGHGLGRQAEAGRDAPEVEARQHDVLPPPAAVAAACTGEGKRLVPPQQRGRAGKIDPSAEVEL